MSAAAKFLVYLRTSTKSEGESDLAQFETCMRVISGILHDSVSARHRRSVSSLYSHLDSENRIIVLFDQSVSSYRGYNLNYRASRTFSRYDRNTLTHDVFLDDIPARALALRYGTLRKGPLSLSQIVAGAGITHVVFSSPCRFSRSVTSSMYFVHSVNVARDVYFATPSGDIRYEDVDKIEPDDVCVGSTLKPTRLKLLPSQNLANVFDDKMMVLLTNIGHSQMFSVYNNPTPIEYYAPIEANKISLARQTCVARLLVQRPDELISHVERVNRADDDLISAVRLTLRKAVKMLGAIKSHVALGGTAPAIDDEYRADCTSLIRSALSHAATRGKPNTGSVWDQVIKDYEVKAKKSSGSPFTIATDVFSRAGPLRGVVAILHNFLMMRLVYDHRLDHHHHLRHTKGSEAFNCLSHDLFSNRGDSEHQDARMSNFVKFEIAGYFFDPTNSKFGELERKTVDTQCADTRSSDVAATSKVPCNYSQSGIPSALVMHFSASTAGASDATSSAAGASDADDYEDEPAAAGAGAAAGASDADDPDSVEASAVRALSRFSTLVDDEIPHQTSDVGEDDEFDVMRGPSAKLRRITPRKGRLRLQDEAAAAAIQAHHPRRRGIDGELIRYESDAPTPLPLFRSDAVDERRGSSASRRGSLRRGSVPGEEPVLSTGVPLSARPRSGSAAGSAAGAGRRWRGGARDADLGSRTETEDDYV